MAAAEPAQPCYTSDMYERQSEAISKTYEDHHAVTREVLEDNHVKSLERFAEVEMLLNELTKEVEEAQAEQDARAC